MILFVISETHFKTIRFSTNISFFFLLATQVIIVERSLSLSSYKLSQLDDLRGHTEKELHVEIEIDMRIDK